MPPRLLLVEDDDHVRLPLRWALEDEGHGVTEAASGEDACAQGAAGPPDLVLVDLVPAVVDGVQVIREVRRSHDLPIVVVSACADTHDLVATLQDGADDHVTTPFEVEEVTARLRALRRRAGGDDPPTELVLDPGSPTPVVTGRALGHRLDPQ